MQALHEFLHMGGYAFYVWSAYGLSLVVLVWCIVAPMQKEKKLLHSLRKRQEREESPS